MILLALFVLVALPTSLLLFALGVKLAARVLTSERLGFRDACAFTLGVLLLQIASIGVQSIITAIVSDSAASVLNLAIALVTLALVLRLVQRRLRVGILRAIGVWALALCIVLIAALVVRSSVIQAFWVPSGAMLPTIQIGDHFFVNKLAYSLRLPFIGTELQKIGVPQRGDVVVFVSPIDPVAFLVKRVIALPGDMVEIRDKHVYVNGDQVPDAHAYFSDPTVSASGPRDNMPPMKVPEDRFFTMADNRDRSYDSRFWGFANLSGITGKVTVIYWSVDNGAPRWSRIGRYID